MPLNLDDIYKMPSKYRYLIIFPQPTVFLVSQVLTTFANHDKFAPVIKEFYFFYTSGFACKFACAFLKHVELPASALGEGSPTIASSGKCLQD